MMSGMRAHVVVSVFFLLVAVPASAAEIDPKSLALHQRDVPSGFVLDRDASGPRTNESEASGDRRARALFKRWGRVSGYQTEYKRQVATLTSRVDLFRTSRGAELFIAYIVEEAKKSGIKGLRRSPVRIGAGGWFYAGGSGSSAIGFVVWRHTRVFAGVVALGVPRTPILALARAQQRRIAAAVS